VKRLIRRARLDDMPGIMELAGRSFQSALAEIAPFPFIEYGVRQDRVTGWWKEQWPKMLVLEQDGEVVGLVQPREAEISGLSVDPRWQGTGAGTALLAAGEEHVRRAGHETAWLTISGENGRALRFYRRRGYLETGRKRRPHPSGADFEDVRLEKRLVLPPAVAPLLEDGVVFLGIHMPEDAAAMVAGEDDEMAHRFGWYPRRSNLEDATRAIMSWRESWQAGGQVRCFAVRDRDGRLVGACEIREEGEGRANISWSIFAAHRRRGYAVRSGALVVVWAFRELGVERLEARVAADNEASLRVAERLGFRREGLLRGWSQTGEGRRDMLLLARLRGDAAPG
jgi:RimJ/RimL family protein N-acetyltransferase